MAAGNDDDKGGSQQPQGDENVAAAPTSPSGHGNEDGKAGSKHHNPFSGIFGKRRWHDDRYEHFVSYSLEDFPQGYPRLAAHINSDIDTLLFRRFGWLRCRAILHLQDELQVLEASLKALDRKHETEADYRLKSKRIDEAFHDEGVAYNRTAMMIEVKAKLDAYDDLLSRQHSISSLPKPGKREFRAYFDWVINEPPLVHDEFQYIYHMDDFLALGQQEDSWQGALLDGISRIMPKYLKRRLLTSGATRSKTSDPNTVYYSNERWELLIKAIVNLAAIGLLVLPIALLYLLNTKRGTKLAMLIVFTIVFNVALAGLTTAKRHEVFGATAAYCAVLVVFLGTISEPQPS